MKIVYLHQYFCTPEDSGGTRSYEWARRLVARGHEVHVVTSFAGDAPTESNDWIMSSVEGIQVHRLPVRYSNEMEFTARFKAFMRFAWSSMARAASLKGDLIFATSTPLTIAIPGIYASWRNRIPMVFEVRDLWPELPIAIGALKNPLLKALAYGLEWLAYHASREIIALSPGMAEGVIRRGISPEHVTVIPNSCDVELFDLPAAAGNEIRGQLGLQPEQPLIVYTGTLGRINRVGYLVELAAKVRIIAPEIQFLTIGGGAEFEAVCARARELGVLDVNLRVWKSIPKKQMPSLLAAATVATSLFMPLKPMWNNSANKFFDALAAGKPIAINYGGWHAELLESTGVGVVLSPDDLDLAAKQLVEFVHDPARLSQASAAARQLAIDQFNRDKLAELFEQVLLRAAHVRAAPHPVAITANQTETSV